MEVSRITVDELKQRLDRGEPIAIVDARSAGAWSQADAQIPGSIRVPPDQIEAHLREVPKDRAVVAYCT